jgi:hypothetical protein
VPRPIGRRKWGPERFALSQGAEETDNTSDALATRGELRDVETIEQRSSVSLNHMPGKASDSMVEVNHAGTLDLCPGSASQNTFNVSE